MPHPTPIPLWLCAAADSAQLESRLLAFFTAAPSPSALMIEGWPGPQAHLLAELPHLQIVRLAPACLCCAGNLSMRVQLNRLLRSRQPLARLVLALSDPGHLPQLAAQLQEAQYTKWLAPPQML
ncbi:GTPase [Massilia sp. W12]|uniref:GTPase n=1 Tax=Massilia sp. W12 TaxID=3126507 RepID=UPI0030CEBDCD